MNSNHPITKLETAIQDCFDEIFFVTETGTPDDEKLVDVLKENQDAITALCHSFAASELEGLYAQTKEAPGMLMFVQTKDGIPDNKETMRLFQLCMSNVRANITRRVATLRVRASELESK